MTADNDCCKRARNEGEFCQHDYPELAAVRVWNQAPRDQEPATTAPEPEFEGIVIGLPQPKPIGLHLDNAIRDLYRTLVNTPPQPRIWTISPDEREQWKARSTLPLEHQITMYGGAFIHPGHKFAPVPTLEELLKVSPGEPPMPMTIAEMKALLADLPEPQKIVMSSAHLAAIKEAIPPTPSYLGFGLSQLLALPVKVDDTVRWPRLEPAHRKLKRSDVTTRIVLDHVAEHRGWAWEHLCRLFPPKVVLAAIMREVDRRRLDYGVAARRPFLTAAGERWLRDNPKDPA